MAASRPPARTRLVRWSGLVLIVYWVALFAATHGPPPPKIPEVSHADKFMHVGAYLVLALLCSCYVFLRGGVRNRRLKTIAVIAAYALVDEILQHFVGRTCDAADWLADVVGATLGIAAFWLLESRLAKSLFDPNHESGRQD